MATWQKIAERAEERVQELELRVFDLKVELNDANKRIRMYEKKVFKLRKTIGKTL